jgi:hypothetical protein
MCVLVGCREVDRRFPGGYVMTKGGDRPIGDIFPGVLASLVGSGLFLFLGGWPAPIRPVGASPIYRAILAALSSDT